MISAICRSRWKLKKRHRTCDEPVNRSLFWLIDRLTDWLIDSFIDWMIHWLTVWLTAVERTADVERAALGNVPANFYESICVPVPDLRDFLTGGGASNNNTANSNAANNNNHNNNGTSSNEAPAPPPPPPPPPPPAPPAPPAAPSTQQQQATLPPPPKLIRAPHLARPPATNGVGSYLEGKFIQSNSFTLI